MRTFRRSAPSTPNHRSNPGNLAVLIAGLGSVGSTLIAGVEAIKRGWGRPIGSIALMEKWNNDGKLPLSSLQNLIFGGWNIFNQNLYQVALDAGVLDKTLLRRLKLPLLKIKPMRGVFQQNLVKNLIGDFIKVGKNKRAFVEAIQQDIRKFLSKNRCKRGVFVNCLSTEAYRASAPFPNLAAFERALKNNDVKINTSTLYTYAALKEGMSIVNATPNRMGEHGWLEELSEQMNAPVAGSDLKTGQTLIKTILAPGFRKRVLGVSGWYSANILGNRDGLVLQNPSNFKSKEISKKGVLADILSETEYPELYRGLVHDVDIHYYPPRGDQKEGWDNIDIFGWLNYPMQIKINFLGRDSILAAPLLLDLILFIDLAQRAGRKGIQEWLGFYFKSPLTKAGKRAENDFFVQHNSLAQELLKFSRGARH